MELLHLILLLTTWLTLHVTSYPLEDHQVPNTTNPLIRRHCVWIPALKQYDCNEFLPTSAQMAWHMRDIKGDGMVGPDSRLIFYANLFPAVADGLNPQQIQQMSEWCVGWMRRNGITAATCQATKTKAWIDYSTNYIADGPHKQDFIDKWGGVDTAQELLGNCWIQAFALSAIFEDVYFFTAHDSQVKDSSSYWIQAERWVLTRPGGSAKRIWQVDPRPEDLGGTACAEPTLYWQRGVNPPFPQRWKCPVTYDDGTIPDLPDPWAAPAPGS